MNEGKIDSNDIEIQTKKDSSGEAVVEMSRKQSQQRTFLQFAT